MIRGYRPFSVNACRQSQMIDRPEESETTGTFTLQFHGRYISIIVGRKLDASNLDGFESHHIHT